MTDETTIAASDRTDTINTEEYTTEIYRILARHGLGPENIEFVDELPADTPGLRLTKCYKIKKQILIEKHVPRDKQKEIISIFTDFDERAERLKDDLMLVRLAVLFEVCHILWRYKNDDECLHWAFHEMKF